MARRPWRHLRLSFDDALPGWRKIDDGWEEHASTPDGWVPTTTAPKGAIRDVTSGDRPSPRRVASPADNAALARVLGSRESSVRSPHARLREAASLAETTFVRSEAATLASPASPETTAKTLRRRQSAAEQKREDARKEHGEGPAPTGRRAGPRPHLTGSRPHGSLPFQRRAIATAQRSARGSFARRSVR